MDNDDTIKKTFPSDGISVPASTAAELNELYDNLWSIDSNIANRVEEKMIIVERIKLLLRNRTDIIRRISHICSAVVEDSGYTITDDVMVGYSNKDGKIRVTAINDIKPNKSDDNDGKDGN